MDSPPLPPAATQNIIYVTQKSRQSELAVGACEKLIINPLHQDEGYSLFNPTRHANVYMSQYKNKVGLSGVDFFDSIAKITLLRRPDKGEIRLVDDLPVSYMPKDRDQGIDDSFIVQVEQYGVRIKVHYSVLIDSSNEINLVDCYGAPVGNNGLWKISQSYTDPSTRESAAWLRSAQLSALLASASQSLTDFADLPGTAVGQTTGEGASATITPDTNAAGHGWYVDPTPLDNTDDYLPTSNPNIWQAKAGSDAAGKMDMLSVLLHEYGHALGLEHSAQLGDFMNTSLQPGQRRLPSSEELALMGQLPLGFAQPNTGNTKSIQSAEC